MLACTSTSKKKGKGFPILHTERWARSWSRCTGSQPAGDLTHPPGGRLPLLSARPAVTSPDAEHHCPLASTKLYCLVIEAHTCKQLAQGCYAVLPWVGFEPVTYRSQVQRSTHCTTTPPIMHRSKWCNSVGISLKTKKNWKTCLGCYSAAKAIANKQMQNVTAGMCWCMEYVTVIRVRSAFSVTTVKSSRSQICASFIC